MERSLSSPSGIAWTVVLLLGVALMVPSIFSGFVLDDLVYQEALRGRIPFMPPDGELFRFLAGDAEQTAEFASLGYFPWWTEDGINIAFFRPFSASLMRLEDQLFPDRPLLHHLHSLLWWGLLLAAAALLYRRVLPGPIAWLALLLFALDESHVLPVGWIANRNALVAVAPALLGLIAHIRWREEGWRPGLPLSVVGLTAGLLGGEMALGVAAYFFAYELIGLPDRVRSRWVGLVPSGAILSFYALVQMVFEYGASGSGIYVDPSVDPLGYFVLAISRVPTLIGAAVAGFWADLWILMPAVRPVLLSVGICAALLLGWLLRNCWPALDGRERRNLRWLLLGGLLALLPVAATFPSDRLLLASALGYCPALACVLYLAWSARKTAGKRLIKAICLVLALVHLVIAPAAGLLYQAGLIMAAEETRRLALAAPLPEASGKHAIMLFAPDHIVGFYLPLVKQNLGRPMPESWRILSVAPYEHRYTRTAADTLQLDLLQGSLMGSLFELLYRQSPLRKGDLLDRGLLRVEIIEVNAEGPVRVNFQFDRPLEDGSLVFLAWIDGELQVVAPPPVGESIQITRTLGPAGF